LKILKRRSQNLSEERTFPEAGGFVAAKEEISESFYKRYSTNVRGPVT
jgi:hypothetical protein